MTDDEIREELAQRARKPKIFPLNKNWADSPVGIWEVSTEGDNEGRTKKNLGFFRGHVADIALYLQGEQCYTLIFNPVKENPIIDVTNGRVKGMVDIAFGIESDTWDLRKDECTSSIEAWLNTEESKSHFTVETSNYFASVKIVS